MKLSYTWVGPSYLLFIRIWQQQASYWCVTWMDIQGSTHLWGNTETALPLLPLPQTFSITPFSNSRKMTKEKTSCQQSLSSKTIVMNTFIFNVSTDFSGINSALKKLIYCSDNFSSYEPWHVNKSSSENSGSAYLHNAVYLTKATFSTHSMKDHPSVVTGVGAGKVEGVLFKVFIYYCYWSTF